MSQIDSLSLTKYKKVQYCSIVSMTRRISIRTVAIVALLLPGLVISAPIARACGLCEDGSGCHLQQPREPSPDTHSCCDTDSETPPETSLGSSKLRVRPRGAALADRRVTELDRNSLDNGIEPGDDQPDRFGFSGFLVLRQRGASAAGSTRLPH